MNQNSCYATPLSSKSFLNSSKSLFNDFVRPSSQFPVKFGSSPFKGSPQSEDFDFIPLSYSSPVTNMNRRGGGGNWKGNNRKNFSPANSSCNSSFSPYGMNKKHFHKSSASSNGNSGFSPYNSVDRPRNYSSNGKRRDNNFLGKMQNSDDISLYYHPSMLEDPWAELEQKLRNSTPGQNCSLGGKHAREKSILNSGTMDSHVSVSDSDEGADSQGTDSSVLSSDGSS